MLVLGSEFSQKTVNIVVGGADISNKTISQSPTTTFQEADK